MSDNLRRYRAIRAALLQGHLTHRRHQPVPQINIEAQMPGGLGDTDDGRG